MQITYVDLQIPTLVFKIVDTYQFNIDIAILAQK